MFFTNSLSSYRNDNFQITKPLTTNSPKQKINKIKTKKKRKKLNVGNRTYGAVCNLKE